MEDRAIDWPVWGCCSIAATLTMLIIDTI